MQPAPAAVPQRIVALAPSTVEILFALGLGDRVVGVGDFTTWPPEAAQLPKLGGLMNANLEAIVELAPDLLIALPSEGNLAAHAEALGIEVLTVGSDTLADVEASIETIGQRCGVALAAERFLADWRQALAPRSGPASGDAASGDAASGDPPRVLLSIARPAGPPSDIFTAGPGSFLDELLTRLGAVNVFADAPASFPTVGLEEVLGRRPEVIIELRAGEATPEFARSLRQDWAAFPQLPAVAHARIEIIAGSHTMLPGPRLPKLYRELAAAVNGAAEPAATGPEEGGDGG